jgi:outer membrane biosynthesis protein TonB
MGERALRDDEKVGLGAAVVLHAALAGVLAMQAVRSDVVVFPDRMTVSLATEVGLEATAPNPVSESRASTAPTLGDNPAPAPDPQPADTKPAAKAATPPPKPATKAATPPPPPARDRSRPDRTAPKQAAATPAKPTGKTGGGSLFDQTFAEGAGSSTTAKNTTPPAAAFGAKEAADLRSAISRQIKRNWTAPNGVEAELLVSVVSWKLNADGTLKGRPTCRTKPESITASNRPQATLHCERAIRAVQLAAPFKLPEQFYSRWDDLEWQFDRRL